MSRHQKQNHRNQTKPKEEKNLQIPHIVNKKIFSRHKPPL